MSATSNINQTNGINPITSGINPIASQTNSSSTDATETTDSTTETENTNSNPLSDNPIPTDEATQRNELNSEAFMRLFLEQLKNQDPTAPMETQQILEQTAQLTQVESQNKMKETMEEMTKAMTSMQETNAKTIESQEKMIESQQAMLESLQYLAGSIQDSNILSGYNAVGLIGSVVETAATAIDVTSNDPTEFSLYFDEPIDASKGDPKITITREVPITDENGNPTTNENGEVATKTIVKEISLKDYDGQSGWIDFTWDTTDNSGGYVGEGTYTISAEYNLDPATNKYRETHLGIGQVQSVLYDNGVPYLKLGKLVLPITYAHTFYPQGDHSAFDGEKDKNNV